MIRFKLCDINISVSYIFICTLTFLILIDTTGLIFASLLAVFCHEAGHLFTMRLLRVKYTNIDFSLATVKVTSAGLIESYKQLLVAISGPMLNFFFSVFIVSGIGFFKYFGAANLIFGFFNLIPAKGLDGGDAIFYALSALKVKKAYRIFNTVSYASIFVIIILGGYITFAINTNPTLLLVGIYLLILSFVKV